MHQTADGHALPVIVHATLQGDLDATQAEIVIESKAVSPAMALSFV